MTTSAHTGAPHLPAVGRSGPAATPGFLDVLRITLAKDMRLEWRSKDAINSMLFFSLLVVVVFSFSFDPSAEESRQIAGGLVWVAFLFAAVVALNQTWARELRNQVLDAYRVSPAPAAVEDCRCALKWVVRNAKEYGFDARKLVVTGHSAGGHLALTTGMLPVSAGLDRQCYGADDAGSPEIRVAAIISHSPATLMFRSFMI